MRTRQQLACLFVAACAGVVFGCGASDGAQTDASAETRDAVGELGDVHVDEADVSAPEVEVGEEIAETLDDIAADASDTDTGDASPDIEVVAEIDTGVDIAVDVGDVGIDTDEVAPACEDLDGDGYGEGPGCVAPDCDDDNPRRNLGMLERCDGIDNDCDGVVNEDDAVDAVLWHRDGDGDGHGDPARTTLACAAPDGYVANADDCDDRSALVHPGVIERCDGVDEDCNGATDDEVADAPRWFLDGDGDGFGSSATRRACVAPVGYVAAAGDCDDGDATRFPGSAERCDGIDHDCDGKVDEADAIDLATFYRDADGDGFGHAATTSRACRPAPGWVADASDCDDTARGVNRAAMERCNGADDDCDGATDEADAVDAIAWYRDGDGDGFGAGEALGSCTPIAGYARELDCDDADATRHPGAAERCDGVDRDCDGVVDEDSAIDALPWHPDRDGDGYGDTFWIVMACTAPAGYIADGRDCDDDAAAARPGGSEVCDQRDNDCDGTTDEDSALDAKVWFFDGDGDGHGVSSPVKLACARPEGYAASSDDCADGDATRHPSAPERCDGVDRDCDEAVNEDDAIDAGTWYRDDDDDGFGDPLSLRKSCAPVVDHVTDARDCDDTAMLVNPDATEVCDSIDNDCDDTTDEDEAADATTWYLDADDDGHGDPTETWTACEAPADYVASSDDCDDDDEVIHPGAAEYCDGKDLDCDGHVDQSDSVDARTWHLDADQDGYGAATELRACLQPQGAVLHASDCDDTRRAVHPNAVEVCNGLDDDCDATTREDGLGPPAFNGPVPLGGYAGRQLRGADFACQRLVGVSFANADLRRASFRRADLRGADFSGADLRWADFEGAIF